MIEFLKKISTKNIFIALFLALFFTCFSKHLFLDVDYWLKTLKYPERVVVYIENKTSKNCKIEEILNTRAINTGTSYRKQIEFNLYNDYQTYKFAIHSKNKDFFRLNLSPKNNKQLILKSLKINEEELILTPKNVQNLFSVETKIKSDMHFVEIIAKKAPIEKNEINIKNYILAFILFIFYFLCFLYLLPKFSNFKIKNYKKEAIIFIAFFMFYLLLNYKTCLNVDHFFHPNNNWRYYGWISGDEHIVIRNIVFGDSRRFHPFFFLPFYPFFEFLMFLTNNLYLTLCIMWCSFASLSVTFLYKTLNLIVPKLKIIKFLILLSFAFCLSQMLMSGIFDLYIIGGFCLSLIIYITTKETISPNETSNFTTLALISALIFGVTIPNIITVLLLVFPLFVYKKECKNLFKFLLLTIILISFFILIKSLTDDFNSLQSIFFQNMQNYIGSCISLNLKNNFYNFFIETLIKPIAYTPLSIKAAIIFWVLFLITLLISLFKNQNKKLLFLNYSLICALIYNFIANFFWFPQTGFIFSQNFIIIPFVILAISINALKGKFIERVIIASLIIFFIFETMANIKITTRQHRNAIEFNPQKIILEHKKW